VIVGTETGTATIVDQDDIARYESMFAELERAAVTGEAARGVLSLNCLETSLGER